MIEWLSWLDPWLGYWVVTSAVDMCRGLHAPLRGFGIPGIPVILGVESWLGKFKWAQCENVFFIPHVSEMPQWIMHVGFHLRLLFCTELKLLVSLSWNASWSLSASIDLTCQFLLWTNCCLTRSFFAPSRLGDVKSRLESCSYQWSDFNDHADHFDRWLDERRAKNDELAAENCKDLVDKKALLKKAKVRS